jgi:hypothetical protein
MNLCYNFIILTFLKKKLIIFKTVKAEIENVFINNKIYLIYFNVYKKIFYIKIILSD